MGTALNNRSPEAALEAPINSLKCHGKKESLKRPLEVLLKEKVIPGWALQGKFLNHA